MEYTSQEKDQLVKQYEPLINKIAGQFYPEVKSTVDWAWLKEMAYEGFAIAIHKYDPERSTQTFMQFAAYSILNNIRTCLTEESRTVKLPFEEQKKRKEAGLTLFTCTSIDRCTWSQQEDSNYEDKPREMKMGTYENAKFGDGNVFEYLYQRLEDQFPQRECDMFYMTFGLKGFGETPNQDIAKHFQVSEGLVSQKKRKILDWIKQDRDLCEMLSNLL